MTLSYRHGDLGGHRSGWPVCRLCPGLAVDLGSARSRAWVPGRGLLLDEPTMISTRNGAGTRPVERGVIVDPDGTGRLLARLVGRRIRGAGRPLITLITPVLCTPRDRGTALKVLEVLRPRTVLTVPAVKAIALGAHCDLARPLIVVDAGAHLTEVALLTDGAVTDAYRTALGTDDLDDTTTDRDLAASVVSMVADMLRLDDTSQSLDALQRGVLLAGGGALRPQLASELARQLGSPVRPAPAPHTAAVRGAARVLGSAHRHPAVTGAGERPPGP